MAFTLTEKDELSWTTSDVLETKHMFTRRLGGVGDYPYSSNPDPDWEAREIQDRVRAQWLALHAAIGFVALFVFNFLGSFVGISLELNTFNAVVTGLLGVPGVILLLLFKYLL